MAVMKYHVHLYHGSQSDTKQMIVSTIESRVVSIFS